MAKTSVKTYKFIRGNVESDGTCLFASFFDNMKPYFINMLGADIVNKVEMRKIFIENLRIEVANYIRKHTELHNLVLNSGTRYLTVEEYCSAIEQGILWGGDIELGVLSSLYNILICKIDLINMKSDKRLIPSYYGEDNPSATECIFIHYNGIDHFDPIYMQNVENPNDIETIFDPNDETTNDLMKQFIRDELKFNGEVILGVKTGTAVQDRPTVIKQKLQFASENPSLKRKESSVDDLQIFSNNRIQVPVSISDEYYSTNKRVKTSEDEDDKLIISNKYSSETTTIKERIQYEYIQDENTSQEEIADFQLTVHDEDQDEVEADQK